MHTHTLITLHLVEQTQRLGKQLNNFGLAGIMLAIYMDINMKISK